MGILFFPFAARWIIEKSGGADNYYLLFLSTPIIIVILILFVTVIESLASVPKKILVAIGLMAVVFLSTNVRPQVTNAVKLDFCAENPRNVSDIGMELETMGIDRVLSVQSFEENLVQSASSIRFLAEPIKVINRYGGPSTPEQFAVIDTVSLSELYAMDRDETTSPAAPYVETAETYGIECVILEDRNNDRVWMEQNGYYLMMEKGKYHVYGIAQ